MSRTDKARGCSGREDVGVLVHTRQLWALWLCLWCRVWQVCLSTLSAAPGHVWLLKNLNRWHICWVLDFGLQILCGRRADWNLPTVQLVQSFCFFLFLRSVPQRLRRANPWIILYHAWPFSTLCIKIQPLDPNKNLFLFNHNASHRRSYITYYIFDQLYRSVLSGFPLVCLNI